MTTGQRADLGMSLGEEFFDGPSIYIRRDERIIVGGRKQKLILPNRFPQNFKGRKRSCGRRCDVETIDEFLAPRSILSRLHEHDIFVDHPRFEWDFSRAYCRKCAIRVSWR